HGDGKKWYENELNYSKKLFEERETQIAAENYFSQTIKERREGAKKLFDSNLKILDSITQKKLENHYANYLHHQVVPLEDAVEVAKTATRACRMECVCRKIYGKSQGECIGLGFSVDFASKYPEYGAKEISVGDLVDYLKELSQNKIVHSVSALRVPYVGMICNCNLRYCLPYRTRKKFGIRKAFYKAEYFFEINKDKCSKCLECLPMCQFGALKHKKDVYIDREKCFGCGLCRGACEEKAMVKRNREEFLIQY
ncbi:MAG: ATP-binding protein, partial [Candidatus Methanofastidiosia archaeon]